MNPETSVIIRTKDEGVILSDVLTVLKEQTYQNFEVVVVDDNSTDGSEKLALKYFSPDRVKVITIPEGKFTHPFSTNLGAQNSAGEYLVYLNGHSVPASKSWLEDGLRDFTDSRVAGVYSGTFPAKRANLIEKFIYNFIALTYHSRRRVLTKMEPAILATTNCIIRKDLWQQNYFDEDFAIGGEHERWADYWLKRGYRVIQEPKFRTYHSHNLSPLGLYKQLKIWQRMTRPSEDMREGYLKGKPKKF